MSQQKEKPRNTAQQQKERPINNLSKITPRLPFNNNSLKRPPLRNKLMNFKEMDGENTTPIEFQSRNNNVHLNIVIQDMMDEGGQTNTTTN